MHTTTTLTLLFLFFPVAKLQISFQVSEEEILSEMIELKDEKESSYYQLVSVPPSDTCTQSSTIGSSDSRLYRLLTTSNGS